LQGREGDAMTTAAEALARTDCADLRRDLDAERVCNRNHLAHINRLNALLVTYERERDERETQIAARNATIAALRAELAEARAGIVAPPY
jgi:uncharacterized protein involved in exopolysaccharide biosynthesis